MVSAKLYSRKIYFTKEPVYDMSLYYDKQPRNMGGCGLSATPKLMYNSNGEYIDGEKLFKANCASCHHWNKRVVGPALIGVQKRWRDAGIEDKIYDWIRNPKKILDEGHPYIKKLVADHAEMNVPLMTPQALSKDEIDAVLMYIGN